MKHFALLLIVVSFLVACTPQTTALEATPTIPAPTQTSLPSTPTATSTILPTLTALPTNTPSATPPTCSTPVNPLDKATVPARGPFDFQWTAFAGAASYIVSIQPSNWYPTNFPVTGTVLTRYMETFTNGPSIEWSITAVNAAGQAICKAGPYTFVTSAQVSATASFNTNVVASNSGNSSGNSSGNNQQGSNNNSNNGSNSSSSNNSASDIASTIFLDTDDAQCRLTAEFYVKSNETFVFIRLIYSANGQQGYVDLTPRGSLAPYPTYNLYSATTPPLPVKQGDTVPFGIWYKSSVGDEVNGLSLYHGMANCSH